MKKPTIKIYKEMIPNHYVGEDCSIVLKYKDVDSWKIDQIECMIAGVLNSCGYLVEEN